MDKHTILLDALRRASLHARLMQNELDTAGVALKGHAINDSAALEWAKAIGCYWLLDYLPPSVTAEIDPTATGGGT